MHLVFMSSFYFILKAIKIKTCGFKKIINHDITIFNTIKVNKKGSKKYF